MQIGCPCADGFFVQKAFDLETVLKAVLPDGIYYIFGPKFQYGRILEDLGNGKSGYILLTIGIFYGHLVNFMPTWYIW
jgi:hypothetical protein